MIEPRAITISFTPVAGADSPPTVRPLELIEAMIANLEEYGLKVEHHIEVDEPLVASVTYRVYFYGKELGNDFPGLMMVAKFTPSHNDEASVNLFADWYSGRIEKVTIDYFDNTGTWNLDVFDRIGESLNFGNVRVIVDVTNFDGIVAILPEEGSPNGVTETCFLPLASITPVPWDFSLIDCQVGDECSLVVKTTHVIDNGVLSLGSQQAYMPQRMSMHPFVALDRIEKMKSDSRKRRTAP
jgi:hypothetical protein